MLFLAYRCLLEATVGICDYQPLEKRSEEENCVSEAGRNERMKDKRMDGGKKRNEG